MQRLSTILTCRLLVLHQCAFKSHPFTLLEAKTRCWGSETGPNGNTMHLSALGALYIRIEFLPTLEHTSSAKATQLPRFDQISS
ncbi:hypothetical protein TcWFU_009693 [Taenia crassiceps]|uniref:Secreted protein n=1 Tax=Taenia crassiceps TaxID=6207 RepID=A0ABR4QND1_9CEST